jgi:hypothetical protein
LSVFRLLGVNVGDALGGSASAREVALPYRRREFLLTRAEAGFYGVLREAVGGEYLIFAKVRLADLLYIPRGTEGRQSAMNRIQSKHIDFVLCTADGVKPCLAVELDDASHEEEERRSRDGFVEAALKAAGLPFLRVRAAGSYHVRELAQRITVAIKVTGSQTPL